MRHRGDRDRIFRRGRQRREAFPQTPEPVFGIIKSVLGFRQFSLRGLDKVRGEWSLVTMACNLKRALADLHGDALDERIGVVRQRQQLGASTTKASMSKPRPGAAAWWRIGAAPDRTASASAKIPKSRRQLVKLG
jgi:hypothetical protein